jgi:hypothetical protein
MRTSQCCESQLLPKNYRPPQLRAGTCCCLAPRPDDITDPMPLTPPRNTYLDLNLFLSIARTCTSWSIIPSWSPSSSCSRSTTCTHPAPVLGDPFHECSSNAQLPCSIQLSCSFHASSSIPCNIHPNCAHSLGSCLTSIMQASATCGCVQWVLHGDDECFSSQPWR